NGSAIKNGNGFIYFFKIDSRTVNEAATTISSVHRINPDGTMAEILSNLEFLKNAGERPIDADGDYFITNSAVYRSNGTKISTGTNAPDRGLSGIAVNGTNVYAANAGDVFHYNGSTWTQFKHSASGSVYGLTYLGIAAKQLLLIPCSEGYGEVVLNASGEPEKAQGPGQSEVSSISTTSRSQYTSSMSDWNMLSIFVVTNPIPAGNDYCLYAGILDPKDDGLWGYYSSNREEWNRE
ncbi:MAG TPA: hypothetical protein GXZ47_03015, partial [Treponema sp.]|nr:hypothetical protein [Treponema sp.]